MWKVRCREMEGKKTVYDVIFDYDVQLVLINTALNVYQSKLKSIIYLFMFTSQS